MLGSMGLQGKYEKGISNVCLLADFSGQETKVEKVRRPRSKDYEFLFCESLQDGNSRRANWSCPTLEII
jgi:hypothetical protein